MKNEPNFETLDQYILYLSSTKYKIMAAQKELKQDYPNYKDRILECTDAIDAIHQKLDVFYALKELEYGLQLNNYSDMSIHDLAEELQKHTEESLEHLEERKLHFEARHLFIEKYASFKQWFKRSSLSVWQGNITTEDRALKFRIREDRITLERDFLPYMEEQDRRQLSEYLSNNDWNYVRKTIKDIQKKTERFSPAYLEIKNNLDQEQKKLTVYKGIKRETPEKKRSVIAEILRKNQIEMKKMFDRFQIQEQFNLDNEQQLGKYIQQLTDRAIYIGNLKEVQKRLQQVYVLQKNVLEGLGNCRTLMRDERYIDKATKIMTLLERKERELVEKEKQVPQSSSNRFLKLWKSEKKSENPQLIKIKKQKTSIYAKQSVYKNYIFKNIIAPNRDALQEIYPFSKILIPNEYFPPQELFTKYYVNEIEQDQKNLQNWNSILTDLQVKAGLTDEERYSDHPKYKDLLNQLSTLERIVFAPEDIQKWMIYYNIIMSNQNETRKER